MKKQTIQISGKKLCDGHSYLQATAGKKNLVVKRLPGFLLSLHWLADDKGLHNCSIVGESVTW
jgi:hypothetical protein